MPTTLIATKKHVCIVFAKVPVPAFVSIWTAGMCVQQVAESALGGLNHQLDLDRQALHHVLAPLLAPGTQNAGQL
jgi:hypothetical protein